MTIAFLQNEISTTKACITHESRKIENNRDIPVLREYFDKMKKLRPLTKNMEKTQAEMNDHFKSPSYNAESALEKLGEFNDANDNDGLATMRVSLLDSSNFLKECEMEASVHATTP